MNDFDLESKLRSVPVPSREEDYWESFPQRVRTQMQRPAPVTRTRRETWPLRLAWGGSIAFACLVVSLTVWCGPEQMTHTASAALMQHGKSFRELAKISNHLRTLLQDEHGLHYLVADQE